MNLAKYPVTIVTCYFEISSKYPSNKYDEWMRNMLLNITTPMIIFCDSKSYNKIGYYRSKLVNSTLLIKTEITEFFTYKYKKQWETTYLLDYNQLDNIELYMIWSEKSNFLNISVNINPFSSEYFLWTDIGYFRQSSDHLPLKSLYNFPSVDKFENLTNKKKMLLQYVTINNGLNIIGGGMFGGHKDIIPQWTELYYKTLEFFFDNNVFAGQDQHIMLFISMNYPELCKCIGAPGINKWFNLHHILRT
jgi:hypothetical protein